MNSPVIVLVAMVLDAIMACGYLAYSAALISLGANSNSPILSKVFLFLGAVMLVSVFLGHGGYLRSAETISKTK